MKKLNKPDEYIMEVFLRCTSSIQDEHLKAYYNEKLNRILEVDENFHAAAVSNSLHCLQHFREEFDIDLMKKLYKNKLAHSKGSARDIYNKILAAPLYGRCPLCSQRTVSELDHHLPQALYPALVISPNNLVPACMECNKSKLDVSPGNSLEETFHPYYDDFGHYVWLTAEVIETNPISVNFAVAKPVEWNDVTYERARHHFRVFKLASLYGSHAAEELTNIYSFISMIFNSSGTVSVRQHLQSQQNTYSANNLNSWQSALYRALASSNWYCSGGFNNRG